MKSPWRYILSSPPVWFGVGLVAIAVNKVAGDVAVAVWMVWVVWFFGRIVVYAIRGLRHSPSAVARIGDPRAWRGELPDDHGSSA